MTLEYIVFGIFLLTALAAMTAILKHQSIKKKYHRQGTITALFVAVSGTLLTILIYIAGGSGARLPAFFSYMALIKYSYKIGWRESLSVFSKIFISTLGLFITGAIIIWAIATIT